MEDCSGLTAFVMAFLSTGSCRARHISHRAQTARMEYRETNARWEMCLARHPIFVCYNEKMDEQSEHWNQRREAYKALGLADKPSIFAQTAVTFFPPAARVLELGAGNGQDSRFFAEQGYDVVSTDLESALEANERQIPNELRTHITVQKVDLNEPLPFENETFDVVYAHLSLHYFDEQTTRAIFNEIARVLKPGGVMAVLVNAVTDPEYGSGAQIEPDFFKVGALPKRFFTTDSVRTFTEKFNAKLLDNNGESYKDAAKGIHGLIRFVGTKRRT